MQKLLFPMKYILVNILIFISFSLFLFSAPKNQVGISLSNISGSGVNINYYLGNKFHIQATAFPWQSGEEPPHKVNKYFNLGLELQRNFYSDKNYRLFFATGISRWWLSKHDYFEKFENKLPLRINTVDKNDIWNFGLSIGAEKYYLDVLSVGIKLGFNYQISDKWSGDELIDHNPEGQIWQGLGIGFSLSYILN
jgi:hypothetical protein